MQYSDKFGEQLVYGIDLGTTNSVISVLKSAGNGKPYAEVIKGHYGSEIVPSCVMLNEDGSLEVGEKAYAQRDKAWVAYSFKKFMGSDKRITLRNGNVSRSFTPTELSSEVLKRLVQDAEAIFGEGNVRRAVITVPAYFDSKQREATIKAAEKAGLDVISLINEPTASIYANTDLMEDKGLIDKEIMVYDLGGGTFDVSVAKVTNVKQEEEGMEILAGMGITQDVEVEENTVIQILSTSGDNLLGGDSADLHALENLINIVKKENKSHGVGRGTREKLLKQLELSKKKYQEGSTLNTSVDNISITYSSDVISEGIMKMFKRTKPHLDKVMRDRKVSAIVLVGGSTKSDVLKRAISEYTQLSVYDSVDPDLSVSMGAAIHAGTLTGNKGFKLLDVLSLPIGIAERGMIMSNILAKDSPIPSSARKLFRPQTASQKEVDVQIYQGVNKLVTENTLIGEFTVEIPVKEDAKENVVEVRLAMDLNGVLSVFVKTETGEVKQTFNIKMISEELKPKESGLPVIKKRKLENWLANVEDSELFERVKKLLSDYNEEEFKEVEVLAKKDIAERANEKIKKSQAMLSPSTELDSSQYDDSDDMDILPMS